jgi:hypothetical protein
MAILVEVRLLIKLEAVEAELAELGARGPMFAAIVVDQQEAGDLTVLLEHQ